MDTKTERMGESSSGGRINRYTVIVEVTVREEPSRQLWRARQFLPVATSSRYSRRKE